MARHSVQASMHAQCVCSTAALLLLMLLLLLLPLAVAAVPEVLFDRCCAYVD
jgi:hypothetical protein